MIHLFSFYLNADSLTLQTFQTDNLSHEARAKPRDDTGWKKLDTFCSEFPQAYCHSG